jgi:hypothetical protein
MKLNAVMSMTMSMTMFLLGFAFVSSAQGGEKQNADTVVVQAVLDGAALNTIEEVYDSLAIQLQFQNYQRSRATVYSSLVQIKADTEIYIKNGDRLAETVGPKKMNELLSTLNAAQQLDENKASQHSGHRLDIWLWN